MVIQHCRHQKRLIHWMSEATWEHGETATAVQQSRHCSLAATKAMQSREAQCLGLLGYHRSAAAKEDEEMAVVQEEVDEGQASNRRQMRLL